MKKEVIWTNLSVLEISKRLEKEHKIKESKTVIYQLLRKHKYGRRKAQKRRSMKETKNRNEQFENIARLKSKYETVGNPVISMDTKKKE